MAEANGIAMNAHFLTFADCRFQPSINRICRQAREMRAFTSICGANQRHLQASFRHQFAMQLQPHVRGFGYWVWKPQIILQTLQAIPEEDILIYADAGCHWPVPGELVRHL